jgi:hypothetical protein
VDSFDDLHVSGQISDFISVPTQDMLLSCGTDGCFSFLSKGLTVSSVKTNDILSCVDLHADGFTFALGTQSEKQGQDIRVSFWYLSFHRDFLFYFKGSTELVTAHWSS